MRSCIAGVVQLWARAVFLRCACRWCVQWEGALWTLLHWHVRGMHACGDAFCSHSMRILPAWLGRLRQHAACTLAVGCVHSSRW